MAGSCCQNWSLLQGLAAQMTRACCPASPPANSFCETDVEHSAAGSAGLTFGLVGALVLHDAGSLHGGVAVEGLVQSVVIYFIPHVAHKDPEVALGPVCQVGVVPLLPSSYPGHPPLLGLLPTGILLLSCLQRHTAASDCCSWSCAMCPLVSGLVSSDSKNIRRKAVLLTIAATPALPNLVPR